MENKFSVRNYKTGDEENIVELLKISFNGWPHFDLECSSLDHWKWKLPSPEERSRTIVVENNDNIIGCDHHLFIKMRIGEKTYKCMQSVDSATHPNYRGMGVYSKIRAYEEHVEQETQLPEYVMYWISTNQIVIKKEDKMGANNFPYPITRLIRIMDINSHPFVNSSAKNLFIKYGFNTLKTINKLEYHSKKIKKGYPKLKIEDANEFDEKFEPFWDKIKTQYSFITERSKEYLKWRYFDPRGGKYIIKKGVENGEIIGYVVLRVNKYIVDYPTGYIVDLCTLHERPDCTDALIIESLRYFDAMGINCVNYCTVKGHPYQKHMEKFGFIDSRSNIFIAYRSVREVSELDEFINATPTKILFQYNDFDWI